MIIHPGEERVTVSASDLRAAAACEWALLREFDRVLGRAEHAPPATDPLARRLADLGMAHEQRVLRELHRERPGRIVSIPRPAAGPTGMAQATHQTTQALTAGAEVVYQAALNGERFAGFADFLVRDARGRYEVWDSKLATSDSVAALLQLALYADRLAATGVPVAPEAVLVLGTGEQRRYAVGEIVPVARMRLARLLAQLDAHQASGAPLTWDDQSVHACGRCEECREQLTATDDVLLVAGVYSAQRKALRAAGVQTVADLSARNEPVPELSAARLARLSAQARLQAQQARTGEVHAEIADPAGLAALPAPSPGDLFFDFEGDPIWSEPGSPYRGLEYLFGVLEAPATPGARGEFRAFWAHDRVQERQALTDFVAYVQARRAVYPDLHIYHYADYERARLLRLAARYGVCEKEIDDLLREGVLVDLYAVVRSAIRVSQDSYSIKKLEPLYMGEHLRSGSVATGGDSVVAYHEYTEALIAGRTDEAAAILAEIRSYNEYDCLSTLRLRDWLLERAREAGVGAPGQIPAAQDAATASGAEIPAAPVAPADPAGERAGLPAGTGPQPAAAGAQWARAEVVETQLRELLGDIPAGQRTPPQQALAMLAAAAQYNRREAKPFWWRHFDRLRHPVDEWAGQSDVVHIAAAEIISDWEQPPRARTFKRLLRLQGIAGPGSTGVRPGTRHGVIYDVPTPPELEAPPGLRVAATQVEIREAHSAADGSVSLVVEESLPGRYARFTALPLALVPQPAPATTHIDTALAELGEEVAQTWPRLPQTAGMDLLLRTPPRQRTGLFLPPVGTSADRFVTAIRDAVLDLDDSYLAVQGPPGTGKTHVAAHVIAHLVRDHGWSVGVVAQSHAAVENVLEAVVRAGLDADLVGKFAAGGHAPGSWTAITERDAGTVAFAADRAKRGYVLGGTAYDVTNLKRVARGQFDLLVVDEAGQYSLANTLACSVAARRLLLLGDPQQLGEVSQGEHPEPVDRSALGWLVGEAATLDPAYGYFLGTTWRMHPDLAQRISQLSYAGQLTSQSEVTAARSLAGLAPGVHVIPVEHRDNTVESPEEAQVVVDQVRELLGREWDDPHTGGGPRPLGQGDLRVVTPYNAQARRLREELDRAGFPDVPVGTVDKFQGQEGVVVLVSMAASSRADVSRGMRFLLQRNRLNVALSRAKWAALLICSPELTDFTPTSARELLLLGAFLRLIGDEPDSDPLASADTWRRWLAPLGEGPQDDMAKRTAAASRARPSNNPMRAAAATA